MLGLGWLLGWMLRACVWLGGGENGAGVGGGGGKEESCSSLEHFFVVAANTILFVVSLLLLLLLLPPSLPPLPPLHYCQIYAKDNDRFFADFAAAYSKLLSLGVPKPKDSGFFSWVFSLCR